MNLPYSITFVGETLPAHELLRSGRRPWYPTAYNVVQDLVDVLCRKGFGRPLRLSAAASERREADMVMLAATGNGETASISKGGG